MLDPSITGRVLEVTKALMLSSLMQSANEEAKRSFEANLLPKITAYSKHTGDFFDLIQKIVMDMAAHQINPMSPHSLNAFRDALSPEYQRKLEFFQHGTATAGDFLSLLLMREGAHADSQKYLKILSKPEYLDPNTIDEVLHVKLFNALMYVSSQELHSMFQPPWKQKDILAVSRSSCCWSRRSSLWSSKCISTRRGQRTKPLASTSC